LHSLCKLLRKFFQNILELKDCDEDSVTQDDHLLTVFFDVSKIQLGENIQLSFQLNPQVWINFKDKAKRTWLDKNVFITAFLSPVWNRPLSYRPFSELSMLICLRGAANRFCPCNYSEFGMLLLQ